MGLRIQHFSSRHRTDTLLLPLGRYWAQLAWQPFSAYLIVKVPARILMPTCILFWGASTVGLAFSRNYGSLLATRFLLGLWEASCLPLFSVVTSLWYRRQEQPFRVALWYGTNVSSPFCAAPPRAPGSL